MYVFREEEVLDDWETGSGETRHYAGAILDLADELFGIQKALFEEVERSSPGRSPQLAIIGRASAIIIDGERHLLIGGTEKQPEMQGPVIMAM